MKKTSLIIFMVLCMVLTVFLSSCFDEESYYTKTDTEALLKTLKDENAALKAELEKQMTDFLNEPSYTVSFELSGGEGNIPVQTLKNGEKVTKPAAPTKEGFSFAGWFLNGEQWSFGGDAVTEDITLTAKWECAHSFTAKEMTAEYEACTGNCKTFVTYYYKCAYCDAKDTKVYVGDALGLHSYENGTCTICDDKLLYIRDGDYIYFGEYPQTIKADDVTITSTTDSRGYYLGSDNAYYARVTADPNSNNYTFSNGSTVTNGTNYYFKVEPIRWRILSTDGESAFILCDSIIANKKFDDSSNNYAESDIRAWLNREFYNTAFTALERELILTTTVNNSVASTGYSSNSYACENTEDMVFLLSYAEATDSAYGFTSGTARCIQTSDYSRATGAAMSTNVDSYGNGYWWLRSPDRYHSDFMRLVVVDVYYNDFVGFDDTGVAPALQIRL